VIDNESSDILSGGLSTLNIDKQRSIIH